jgi:DNA-binding GntR family transcriptional regulator
MTPIDPRNAPEAIHDRLRAQILSGELAAGAELSQAQVAKHFGVSRGPVREALRLLQREGLIEAEVNHRARVTGLSLAEVEHVYALRVVNEALALAVSVPRLTTEDLDELERLAGEIGDPTRRGFAAWEAAHQRFHALLLNRSGDRLERSLAQWAQYTERYRRVYLADESGGWTLGAAEHAELARTCRAADPGAASRLLARHLSRAGLSLVATMDPTHEPVLLRAAVRQVFTTADAAG